MNEVFVNMGQIGVLRYTGVLVTVGLGSCVGVSLYDPSSKVGALAHVFGQEPGQFQSRTHTWKICGYRHTGTD